MIYTVKSVGAEPREWSSSHGGTFLSYSVDLENEDGTVEHGIEWTKKPESRAPAVGERVAGHIEPGKFSEKFKIDYEATKELGPQSVGGGGSERSSGGGSKGGHNLDASIAIQVALKVLSPTINQAVGEGRSALPANVKLAAGELQRFILEAGQAARGGQPIGDASGASDVSSTQGTSAPPSPPANTEQRDLEMAIDGASAENLSAEARAQVAAYMLSELPEDERSRAFSQLTNSQDPAAQGQTIRAMKARTEKWTGAPLAVADVDPDDELPFRRPEYREMFSERERWRF